MARRGGWRRVGSRGRFRYVDHHGRRITDDAALARIDALRIPPAWREVWISPSPRAKLQATGLDAAGRKQYLYHPDFRAAREEEKFARLVLFGERLPQLRRTMTEHMELDELAPERVCALAVRLVNLGWFRVGNDRHTKISRTFGITTLTKRHAKVRGNRVEFRYRGKGRALVHAQLVDPELAGAVSGLLELPGSRLFRYRAGGELANLSSARLNAYVKEHLGEEFTIKDFRTWGGTLIAAIVLAERGLAETEAEAKRAVAAAMRTVGERLGNTPAVARASYVSPAVVEQYLEGVTLEDFRPRNLRVVGARDVELDREERALLSLLRSWRIKRARAAA